LNLQVSKNIIKIYTQTLCVLKTRFQENFNFNKNFETNRPDKSHKAAEILIFFNLTKIKIFINLNSHKGRKVYNVANLIVN